MNTQATPLEPAGGTLIAPASGNGDGVERTFAYIASPSFSGSTLLTFLLNAHPDICTVGELKGGMRDGYGYVCSCGVPCGECRFWRDVIEGHARQGVVFDLNDFRTRFERQPGRLAGKVLGAHVRGSVAEWVRDAAVTLWPSLRNGRDRTLRAIEHFARVSSAVTGASVFLDASKDPFRLKYLPGLRGFRLKVVRLVRDGRGVVNSMMRNEGYSVDAAARSWRRTSTELDRMEAKIPACDRLRVSYEALCRAPDQTLAAIYGLLGLDPSRAAADYREVEHHILGNRMRLRSSSEIRLDEKWRLEMSEESLAAFEREAGDLNRKLGYE